jgi:hypothetical protein
MVYLIFGLGESFSVEVYYEKISSKLSDIQVRKLKSLDVEWLHNL